MPRAFAFISLISLQKAGKSGMASRSLKARSCGRSRRRQDCHYDVVWVLSVGAPVRTRRGPRCRSHTHQILCVRIMPTKSYVPARNVFLYNFIFHEFGALPDMRDDGDADDLVELLEACAQIDKASSRTATLNVNEFALLLCFAQVCWRRLPSLTSTP